ncbi:MAG: hypothetical protein ACK5ME_04710 [Parahaliea sp.]
MKGYLRGQRNDYNDALVIAEACLHNRIRGVAIKTAEQQDEHSFHGIRRSLNADKLRLNNQLRGFLGEYGLVFRQHSTGGRIAWAASASEATG